MTFEHAFTRVLLEILQEAFGDSAIQIFQASDLLQYLNIKTKSAEHGSKSRPAFANHYALYVLIEDYLQKGYLTSGNYAAYEGARFVDLFQRQRQLPFGGKLQNHALNHRLNEEFKRYFPQSPDMPILRDTSTGRYWMNEKLLRIQVGEQQFNLATVILKIIERYIDIRKSSFEAFLGTLSELQQQPSSQATSFIRTLLQPQVEARLFEIVSYAILKIYYADQTVLWGENRDILRSEPLHLYKTGRTNANDGGIDFVMKPLGRFFQVTETVDFQKYFLDIDKIHRYPLTFVVKSLDTPEQILEKIKNQAEQRYPDERIVQRYLQSIEEIINIPTLITCLEKILQKEQVALVLKEIILQSKVEFNYD